MTTLMPSILLLLLPTASQTAGDLREADELLAEAAAVYSSCSSYRDRGTVETVVLTSGSERTVRKPFTTAFVRPDRFRFEYRSRAGGPGARPGGLRDRYRFQQGTAEEKWDRYIVFADGADVKTWWDARPESRSAASLSLAIAGATGVSGGSSLTIPALLMPAEVQGFKLTDLEGLQRLDDERLGAFDCFRIQGTHPRGQAYTIWMEKKSLLIRQLVTTSELPETATRVPATVRTTTYYEPEINVEIREEELRFGAPDVPEPDAVETEEQSRGVSRKR